MLVHLSMNYLDPSSNKQNVPPAKGKLLIAEPFLHDKDFTRSVIFLCEHSEEGTLGFVLNQPTALTLGDILQHLDNTLTPLAIYNGGPVQPDTLHIVHRMPEKLGGVLVADGIYWGGSYELLQEVIKDSNYEDGDLRLFLGYSGWSAGQLPDEMKEGTWLVGDVTQELVFETEPHRVWKGAMKTLGKDFAFLANMPIDPQLN